MHRNNNVNSGEHVDRAARAVVDRALEAQAQDCPWTAHTLVRCEELFRLKFQYDSLLVKHKEAH